MLFWPTSCFLRLSERGHDLCVPKTVPWEEEEEEEEEKGAIIHSRPLMTKREGGRGGAVCCTPLTLRHTPSGRGRVHPCTRPITGCRMLSSFLFQAPKFGSEVSWMKFRGTMKTEKLNGMS